MLYKSSHAIKFTYGTESIYYSLSTEKFYFTELAIKNIYIQSISADSALIKEEDPEMELTIKKQILANRCIDYLIRAAQLSSCLIYHSCSEKHTFVTKGDVPPAIADYIDLYGGNLNECFANFTSNQHFLTTNLEQKMQKNIKDRNLRNCVFITTKINMKYFFICLCISIVELSIEMLIKGSDCKPSKFAMIFVYAGGILYIAYGYTIIFGGIQHGFIHLFLRINDRKAEI